MLSSQTPPTGQLRRNTLLSFPAPTVVQVVRRRYGSGLIGDRQSTPKPTVANGKNFTSASVVLLGGPGVAIAPRQNSPPAMTVLLTMRFFNRRSGEEGEDGEDGEDGKNGKDG